MDLAHPALPRDEVVAVATGTAFVVIGILAGAVAAVRRRGGVRVFAWLGVGAASTACRSSPRTPSVVAAPAGRIQAAAPWSGSTISYLLVVAATLAWRELSLGRLRLSWKRSSPPASDRAGRDRHLPREERRRACSPSPTPCSAAFGLLTLVTAVALPEGLLGRVHRAAAPWRVGRRHPHVRDRGAVHQPGPLVRLPLVPPARLARASRRSCSASAASHCGWSSTASGACSRSRTSWPSRAACSCPSCPRPRPTCAGPAWPQCTSP